MAPRNGAGGGGVVCRRSQYVLSGILVCDACGSPMSVMAGTSMAYYRCQRNRTKGLCAHATSVREDVAKREIFAAIRDRLMSPDGLAHVRRRVAEELRDYSKKLDAEVRDRRSRQAHRGQDPRADRLHLDR